MTASVLKQDPKHKQVQTNAFFILIRTNTTPLPSTPTQSSHLSLSFFCSTSVLRHIIPKFISLSLFLSTSAPPPPPPPPPISSPFSATLLLLLSLNAHNHVDDYSGTLGGVRKVNISALVTSPRKLVVALSFCSILVLRHIIFITSYRLHVIVKPTIFQAPKKLNPTKIR